MDRHFLTARQPARDNAVVYDRPREPLDYRQPYASVAMVTNTTNLMRGKYSDINTGRPVVVDSAQRNSIQLMYDVARRMDAAWAKAQELASR
jgi:hypothetical protein